MGKTSKHPKSGPARASSGQIVALLSERPAEVYRALGLRPAEANLSMPTDGRGPRIRASVRPPQAAAIPESITLAVGNREVAVEVEVAEDFQEFRPL